MCRNVCDVLFSYHLIVALSDFSTAGVQTVLEGHTPLGHRHTFSVSVHHVECVTVFGVWKTRGVISLSCVYLLQKENKCKTPCTFRTVDIRSPAVTLVVICSVFTGEALEASRMRCSCGGKKNTHFFHYL